MAEEVQNVTGSNVVNGFGEGEYAEYQKLKVELRQRRVDDAVKAMGSIKSGILRQRLALRRIDIKKEAPNEDLVAYDAIHKLKNPGGDSKQKVLVTDNEIAAYKMLDPEFIKNSISLADVLGKVNELKAAGAATNAGDNAGGDDDPIGE